MLGIGLDKRFKVWYNIGILGGKMKTFVRNTDFSFGVPPNKENRKGIKWDVISVGVGHSPGIVEVNDEKFRFDSDNSINFNVRELMIKKNKIEAYWTEDFIKQGKAEAAILDSVVFQMDSGNHIQLIFDDCDNFETFTMLLDEVNV